MVMIKYYIPILLAVTVVIAGVFAFMPVQEASTVHTQIFETTTNLVEVSATGTVDDDDFEITCPTTSDACKILEVFLDDDIAGQLVDPGPATLDIDGAGGEDPFVVAADTGAQTVGNEVIALTGVSNLAMGPGDILRIEVNSDGNGFDYTLTVIAEVEGNETIEVANVVN